MVLLWKYCEKGVDEVLLIYGWSVREVWVWCEGGVSELWLDVKEIGVKYE